MRDGGTRVVLKTDGRRWIDGWGEGGKGWNLFTALSQGTHNKVPRTPRGMALLPPVGFQQQHPWKISGNGYPQRTTAGEFI